ncbi:hypothetical protein [Pseudaeromonas paramecii]|uniref:Uncharacterized protein n=1 Tax=Pseudaeromonas paramecii TaxID=2138166 RepID=A0ABP8QDS7_9GAMM
MVKRKGHKTKTSTKEFTMYNYDLLALAAVSNLFFKSRVQKDLYR